MDVLRPQIIRIGDRCYRKNPTLERDITADEEEEYDDGNSEDFGYCDEACDLDISVEETDGGFQLKLDVPSVFFKHIIGRKAETKRRLETETRTQIRIPKNGQDGPIVIQGHDRKGVISAKTRIDLIVDGARQREPFTHFLSIPINNAKMQESFAEFRTDVLRECDGDRGIDGSIFQKLQKLHLTIGILALMDDKEIHNAEELLNECKENLIEPILKSEPLLIHLRGLEYMNDDPRAVDVMYAKIDTGENLDKLQMIVDRIVDKFTSAGIMTQEYDRVKLHVTIMNTLFRRDPTGAPVQRQKGKVERESFDAYNLIKRFGNYDFGEYCIDKIHLSQKHGSACDGYYYCTSSINIP
ncbi:activating signal cointegrator 1 complex subunit 1-like [Mytilus edulis]|uniref:activating signal cointegrator 1 complex subunit 1-like n=1 Tax=Mytilus edulis TaxID=6550 RepID=UPI0039F0A9FD